jgi:hypothetical protein
MGTKSREVIFGGQVRAAKMNAEHARKRAVEAAREADRAEAHAWSLRMEGFGGPAQPSPTIGQPSDPANRYIGRPAFIGGFYCDGPA